MPNKNVDKGKRFERKVVKFFQSLGHKARRTWGSSGKSEGLPEEVDVVVDESIYIQCKVRDKLPELYKPINKIDYQFVGEYNEMYVVMKAEKFAKLFKD